MTIIFIKNVNEYIADYYLCNNNNVCICHKSVHVISKRHLVTLEAFTRVISFHVQSCLILIVDRTNLSCLVVWQIHSKLNFLFVIIYDLKCGETSRTNPDILWGGWRTLISANGGSTFVSWKGKNNNDAYSTVIIKHYKWNVIMVLKHFLSVGLAC